MAADITKIVEILLKIESNTAQKQVEGLNASLNKTGSSAAKMGAIAGASMAVWTKAINIAISALKQIPDQIEEAINQAAKAEVSIKRLGFAFGNLATGARVFQQIQKDALKTGDNIEEVAKTTIMLANALNKPAKEIQQLTNLVQNLSARTGESAESIAANFQKMYANGVDASREFNRNGTLALLGFQKGVQYTAEEFQAQMMAAATNVGSSLMKSEEEMAGTWEGMTKQLSNQWEQVLRDIAASGLFEYLKAGLKYVLDYINALRKDTEGWAFYTTLAGQIILNTIKVVGGAIAMFFAIIWDTVKAIWGLLIATGKIIVAGIGLAIEYVGRAWTAVGKIVDRQGTAFLYFSKVVQQVWGVIKVFFLGVLTSITNIAVDIMNVVQKLGNEIDNITGFWGLGTLKLTEKFEALKVSIQTAGREQAAYAEEVAKENEDAIKGIEAEIEARKKANEGRKEETNWATEFGKALKEKMAASALESLKIESTTLKVGLALANIAAAAKNVHKSTKNINDEIDKTPGKIKAATDEVYKFGKSLLFGKSVLDEYNTSADKIKNDPNEWARLTAEIEKAAAETVRLDVKTQRTFLGMAKLIGNKEQIAEYTKNIEDGLKAIEAARIAHEKQTLDAIDKIRQDREKIYTTMSGGEGKATAAAAQAKKLQDEATLQRLLLQQQRTAGQQTEEMYIVQEEKILNLKLKTAAEAIDAETQDLAKRHKLLLDYEKLLQESLANQEKLKAEYYQKEADRLSKLPSMEEQGLPTTGLGEAAPAADTQARQLDAVLAQAQAEKDARLAVLEDEKTQSLVSWEDYQTRKSAIIQEGDLKISQAQFAILNLWKDRVKSTTDSMASDFAAMYEATGKKQKALLIASKAMSIASTIISTYEGAQKAYTSMAGIPYVGPALGIAAAAIAVAGGLARVALIAQQNYAEGGKVGGSSPHDKADNISARLTAGEFVQPVSSVRYYGPGIMEAMRRQMVPRDLFSQYNLKASMGYSRFATGGMAVPAPKSPDKEEKKQDINIVNITTQDQLDEYLSTKPGEERILNVINRYNRQVKAMIQQ